MRNNCTKIKYSLRFLPIVIMVSNYQSSGTDNYTELKQEMNNSYDSKEFLEEINNEIMKIMEDENFSIDSDNNIFSSDEQYKEFEYLLQHKFWKVSEKKNIEENDKEEEKGQCNSAQKLKIYKNLSISKVSNYNYLSGQNMVAQTNDIYLYFPVFQMNNIILPEFQNINTININNKEQINSKEEQKQESKNIERKRDDNCIAEFKQKEKKSNLNKVSEQMKIEENIKQEKEEQKHEDKNIEGKKDGNYITEFKQKKEKSNLTKLFEQIEIEKKEKQKQKKTNNKKKYKSNTRTYYGYQNVNKDNFNNRNEHNYNTGYLTNNKWNNKKFANQEYKTSNTYYGKYQYNKTKNNIQYKIEEHKQEEKKINIKSNANNKLGQKQYNKKAK